MNEEDKISSEIVKSLKEYINYSNIKIEHKKEVFIGTTCGVFKDDFRLLFQSAEQDIVISLKDEKNKYIFEGDNFFRKFPKSLVDNRILIPLVIFEVKYKKINTHTVRQYSELARIIKQIFPFCNYNLLLLNISKNKKENANRIYMAGKNFDRVIYKENFEIDNPIYKQVVKEMSNIIKFQYEYLKNDEFYGLSKFL